MPTKNGGKVRHLLKQKKAKIVRREPFAIQLLYETTHYVQPVDIGIDPSPENIGISAANETEELFKIEVHPRGREIKKNLATRRECRKNRRSRKTRYRAPRFLNRVRSKKKGWLPPSVQSAIDCHLHWVSVISGILPVKSVQVEVASFDLQKLQADWEGLERPEGAEYQEGPQLGFWNAREYVLYRDGHECQCCHGESGDNVLEVHHIESRKTGGNAPNNLVTLCKTCHDAYHAGERPDFHPERGKKFDSAVKTSIISTFLTKILRERGYEVGVTYGFITKSTRIEAGLPKEHVVDALCISGHARVRRLGDMFVAYKKRCHNRSLHKMNIRKGELSRRANQCAHTIRGFHLFDKVCVDGVECFIAGKRVTGQMSIKGFDDSSARNVTWRRLKMVSPASGWLVERRRVG